MEVEEYATDWEEPSSSAEWNSQEDDNWYDEVSGCQPACNSSIVSWHFLSWPVAGVLRRRLRLRRASPSRRLLHTWLHGRPLRVRGLDNARATVVPAAEQHRAQTNSRRPERLAPP